MSEYCKHCDTLTNEIIKNYDDNHRLVWVGCFDCYKKRIGMIESVKSTG